MPTYEYHCKQCGERLEAFQKITDAPLKKCAKCGAEALQRGPGGGAGLIFTGSGWYKTDYASPGSTNSSSESSQTKSTCCPCGKNQGSCSSK